MGKGKKNLHQLCSHQFISLKDVLVYSSRVYLFSIGFLSSCSVRCEESPRLEPWREVLFFLFMLLFSGYIVY